MQPRTRRQKDVLDVISRYIENNGHLPSYQMIARHIGVTSKSGIARHVRALEAQGLIRRRIDDGRFKLELCEHEKYETNNRLIDWLRPPAGHDAEEWENNSFSIPRFLLGMYVDAEVCAFRVPDDSLGERHICEGDVALVERRSFAREGSIVVAFLPNGDAVMRKFYRNGSNIELRAENVSYESIDVCADSVTIAGVYRALIRPIV